MNTDKRFALQINTDYYSIGEILQALVSLYNIAIIEK